MRNKFFKFNENYAKVIKHLDDRQAGQYVRAISDYAFEGKTYGGKDTAVKTAFTLTKQMIDDEKFYREKGRLGGQKIAERKRTEDGQNESDTVLKSVIETVVASEALFMMSEANSTDESDVARILTILFPTRIVDSSLS